ncbi:MAG: UDP-N-acetylglucosamine 2-epimerase (non-hydrolyzing), partial [Chloroflexota bacterium]|nr:UDP-N-acetylglucosamine 2-epimerase (non-hydrolyzing) [Chloroflexota bacterium]
MPLPRHVALILGTRPEATKLAPLALALRAQPQRWRCTLIGTGQHHALLPQTLAAFGLAVDYDLAVMRPDQSLTGLTARLLDGLDPLLAHLQPDWTLVQGDTTTAMAGALAAFYRRLPVAHVEAGLRTYDRFAPYPEEANRRIISSVADLHFAVTAEGAQRLTAEGIAPATIAVVGNTGIDALLWMRACLRTAPAPAAALAALPANLRLILVTGHRRENFGGGIAQICAALRALADRFPDVAIVYPVHPNPQVQEPVYRLLADHPRIVLCAPLPYAPFVALMDRATLILTDSGGVQEEAPSLGKPVLVLRETTER